MDRAKAAATLCCLLAVACGGDPEQPAGAAGESSGGEGSGGAIAAANQPPVIESVALEPAEPRPGESVSARVTATDPEGDLVTLDYRWRVAGMPAERSDGAPTFHVEAIPTGTNIEVVVVARDAHGESAPVAARAEVGNLPPSIIQVDLMPSREVTAGTDVTASPKGMDPEGSSIDYRFQWSVNDSAVPVHTATLPASFFKRGDKISLEVVASDGDAESKPLFSAPIEVVNAAPKIVSQPGAIGSDGVFRYAVTAEDPDGDRVFRYRLAKGPVGMTVGFDDGKVVWDPPATATGSHEVEIEVADNQGARSLQRFTLDVSFSGEEPAAKPPAPAAEAP
jgi:hypothetical protein